MTYGRVRCPCGLGDLGGAAVSYMAELVSDCVGCQTVCHGFWSLRTALRMVRSLRATAMRATILGFPAATRRPKKAFRTGLCRLAAIAPMKRAVRTLVR